MIKVGDKAKGFEFADQEHIQMSVFMHKLNWNSQMEKFIGVEGIVKGVRPEINELVISFMVTTTNVTELHWQHWTYPLDEYLVIQREQRLNEIGI